MATDFTQESVLGFLRYNQGRVKNSTLLAHFKYFLKEDENRAQNRELFKKFVNAVAAVKHEDGVSYVVLRKKFKVPGGDIGSTHIPKRQEEKPENPRSRHRDRSPRKAASRSQERIVSGETSTNPKTNIAVQVPTSVASERSLEILPAAGIVNNNNNNVETVNFEKAVKMSPPQTWESSPPSIIINESNYSPTLKPLQTPPFICESKRSSGSGQSFEHAWDKELVETTVLEHKSIDIGNLGQAREADGCSATFRPTSVSGYSDSKTFSLEELRPNPKLQQLQQSSQSRNVITQPAPWPLHPSLCNTPGISSSSPCIADIESPPFSKAAHQMSFSNDCLARPEREFSDHVHGELVHTRAAAAVNSPHLRRSLPLDPSYMTEDAAASPDHHYRTPLSSTHDCLSGSDCEWPFPLTQETWSSDDSLHQRVPLGSPSDQVREMLQRAHDAKLLALLHQPERTQTPGYHRSTGFLDQESPGSRAAVAPGSGPGSFLRPTSGRASQRHRSRLSRSLGAGLDQPFPEDHEVARHNRLLLLSSSLSINYPLAGSPERSPSSRDVSLSGASSTASLSPCNLDRAFVQRSTQMVPLEPKEHEWMVKAASGDWPVIYSLFRDDCSLLAKRDFISGYTVLHWIAKHGDHRVLNTLWYGVNKAGMKLDVDVQTTCGYTPLHLAAMYGHKKLLRLLVHKFKANIKLRDTSGRRAWQYLDKDTTGELPQILGAPQKKKKNTPGGFSHSPADKHTERPSTISATVKRHSSLAALFKHKSLGRIAGHTEMSV